MRSSTSPAATAVPSMNRSQQGMGRCSQCLVTGHMPDLGQGDPLPDQTPLGEHFVRRESDQRVRSFVGHRQERASWDVRLPEISRSGI
jgi:hypothetical protein